MHRCGGKLAFDDHIGFLKSLVHIPQFELVVGRDVAELVRVLAEGFGF
jgi:hypothetical protein